MLRVATAGSVDDGKSTLIGRLLHDSKSLMADELGTAADLARLTDGLRAEREQGITIDVAYRHFATPNRRFVLHDCPGHAQYTRNMATGASTADLALVLVDARRGMTEQSRRHLAIAALLGVPGVTVLINKMDLVGYAEERFDAVAREVLDWASRLGLEGVGFIPVSALHGDNVVERSAAMPWYAGESLLEHLEAAPAGDGLADGPARLPIQYVIRAAAERWYAGRLASGTLRVGDDVVVLPSGTRSRVAAFEDGADTAVAAPLDRRRARGRARRRPRRPARARLRGARAGPRARGHAVLARGRAGAAGRPLSDQAHDPLGAGEAGRDRAPARRHDARPRARRRARAQRHRPGPTAPRVTARAGPVRPGPGHRRVHRRR